MGTEYSEVTLDQLRSFIGLFVLILLAWLLSSHKKEIRNMKGLILTALLLQFLLGFLILWSPAGKYFFSAANSVVSKVLSFSDQGAAMIFGENFREHYFAFSVLPTIIFMSALMSVLFHLGIIQKVVNGMAWVIIRFMKVSGAEALAACANVFVGQTEAPLVVKPYIAKMTSSELMCLMVGGMANIAGGVMAAYVSFGADAGHLLASSLISAPACLLISKIILPELGQPETLGKATQILPSEQSNVLEAACTGATEGLSLALNVAAMLLVFVALTGLVNEAFSLLPAVQGQPLSVERILGWLFAPLAYFIGVDVKDVWAVGQLLGKKMFLNEFIAYLDLKELKGVLSERSFTLSTYALCGFANFSSIAIQIGGIGHLVPSRRKEIAHLGIKAMLGGTLATLMTACIAGILI